MRNSSDLGACGAVSHFPPATHTLLTTCAAFCPSLKRLSQRCHHLGSGAQLCPAELAMSGTGQPQPLLTKASAAPNTLPQTPRTDHQMGTTTAPREAEVNQFNMPNYPRATPHHPGQRITGSASLMVEDCRRPLPPPAHPPTLGFDHSNTVLLK